MDTLNSDVLELIFSYMDFKSLLAVELTCVRWRDLVRHRRLFWQLSKRLLARPPPFKGVYEEARRATRVRVKRMARPVKLYGKRGRNS